MTTGWVRVGGSWFFLNPDSGAMATGWMMIRGTWYYLSRPTVRWSPAGCAWGSSWYYMGGSGAMVTGTQVVDGRRSTSSHRVAGSDMPPDE